MRRIVVTRATPGEYTAPDAKVVVGPNKGFLDQLRLHDWLREQQPISALVTMFHDVVDEALLDAAGDSLQVVCNFASGYENIDVAACAARNVIVCNTPDAVTEGAADMAWALLLAAARRLREAGEYVRSSDYPANGPLGMGDFLGLDITGRTLLIVGAGRIGYAMALRSIGWGMRVLYVSRTRKRTFEFAPLGARRVTLEGGLEQADFISLHTPLTDETQHLIGPRELGLMKSTAVLINVSRGPVIDEQALVDALKARRIFAAGLDVYEEEPQLTPGLADLPNAILTPHIGSAEARYRAMMTEIICDNIRAVFAGLTPSNAVATG